LIIENEHFLLFLVGPGNEKAWKNKEPAVKRRDVR
jgi:hypothetical protein